MSTLRRVLVLAVLLAAAAAAAWAEVQLTALTLPKGTPVEVNFSRTDRAPGKATMAATFKFDSGQTAIDLTFDKMEPAILFSGDISAYVVWAVSIDGSVDNLGELIVDKKNASGSQPFTVSRRIFALMVTAEPFAAVKKPADVVIFTSGSVQMKQVPATPFKFSDFDAGPKPALQSIASIQYNDETPVALKQAEKAVAVADAMKAADVNPQAVRDAKNALLQANGMLKAKASKKEITNYARIAVQLASQAIVDTRKAVEAKAAADAEAKRLAEKAALEQRANAAESESQRIARELKEVQIQREALASESKNLAQVAEKLASERDTIAAERDTLAADREAIKKERDDLAGMLKGALSTVAETNETARGVIVSLPGILFDLNKATLKVPAQLTVAKLAGILMVFQTMNLSIEGHTDSTGTDEFNNKLSTERAKAVYDFLKDQGIAASRMKFDGFGSSKPVAPNDTEANRAKNRRVEVVLTRAPSTK